MARQTSSNGLVAAFVAGLLGFASPAEAKCTIDQMVDAMVESGFDLTRFEEDCDFDIEANKCSFHQLEERIHQHLQGESTAPESSNKEQITAEVKKECIN